MQKFLVLHKEVGQTPLDVVEEHKKKCPEFAKVPMAYAGRLDPMASGKLLILLGDECKQQEKYHNLDKKYRFEVLFNTHSDTADVLGIISHSPSVKKIAKNKLTKVTKKLTGDVELPYPHFSSKTVQGKPLHTWTLEGRIDEIEIPTKKSTIYKLKLVDLRTESTESVYKYATEKIETIPPVTDARKAIGNDFRRSDVRRTWKEWLDNCHEDKHYIATFDCIASSGTYMRTLSEVIAKEFDTTGLAYSIKRTEIGNYKRLFLSFGYWKNKF